MRLVLVYLLALLAVGVAAPLAAAEDPPFEWTMPARLGADDDGDGLIDYAGSAAELKEEEGRESGFAVELTVRHDLCGKGVTYTWRSAAGEVVERGGAGCSISQRFPHEGSYRVGLELAHPGGRVEHFARELSVRDWLVVSIGDSVAAGEGNPDIPSGIAHARWQSSRCHRSAKAGPALAALDLEAADPQTTTTFVHLACSGASIGAGLLGGYRGIDAHRFAEPRLLAPQVDELEQIASRRHVDAVLLSVGANDVYFGPIVRFCMLKRRCTEKRFDPEDEQHPTTGVRQVLPEVVTGALGRIGGEYAALAGRLSKLVAPDHVLIVDYFDPTRDSRGEFCERIGLPLPLGALQIDRDEAEWAATEILEPLNTKVGEAAESAGWTEVTGVSEAFRAHGYCAEEPWIRHITRSFITQKGDNFFSRAAGTLHPNEEGHRAEGAMIALSLDRVLYGEPAAVGEDDDEGGVVVVVHDDEPTQTPGEASLEHGVWVGGLLALVAAGLLAGAAFAIRRVRRPEGPEAAGEGAATAPIPFAPPDRWPLRRDVEAFGALLEDSSSWVHRRVESIEIVDERLVRRRVSVDFTPEPPRPAPSGTHVPIALLAKRILNRFDFRDESGASVPLATSEQNAAFAAAHMLAIAEEATGERPSERLKELCWTIARGDPPEAEAAVNEIATRLEPAETREALRKDERFRSATVTFAASFAVIVEVDDPSRRRVMKFAYDQIIGEGLTWRQRLGLDPVLALLRIPELGDAGSRHIEFLRAEGLEALSTQLIGVPPEGEMFARDGSREGGEAHVTVGRVPRGTRGLAGVSLRASRSGILVGGPLLAALSAVALTAAWFALPDLAGDSSGGAASILLAIPAALGAYLGAREPHPLEAAMLWGARRLVFLSGMLAFIGAGALALDSSVAPLRIIIGVVALASWLPVAGLVATRLLPRPPRNGQGTVL